MQVSQLKNGARPKRTKPVKCVECGKDTMKPTKGHCGKCYSRKKGAERREKRNQFF